MDMVLHRDAGAKAIWIVGGLALAWNAYGVFQFLGSVSATPESLVAAGLTAEQAAVMTGYPMWMTVAFAIGVFGGLAGSLLLLARNANAVGVFHLSLAGYVALYAGDIVHGVFAAMGLPQIIVLSVVVALAAALSLAARRFARSGQLG